MRIASHKTKLSARSGLAGIPLVYELNDDLKPMRSYYQGDEAAVEQAAQAVAGQVKKA